MEALFSGKEQKNFTAKRVSKAMKKKNSQCGRRGERVFSNVCVLPSFIGVLIFFLIPFCIVIYYSLINNPISAQFVGLDNFRRLFQTVAFRKAAANTAAFSLISAAAPASAASAGVISGFSAG